MTPRGSLPDGVRVYAIGDIHGRFDLLQEISASVRRDLAAARPRRSIEVYLGDYVDRGPQSRDVVEWLIEAPLLADERVCLMGNHESMLLDALKDDQAMCDWLYNGAVATLRSYGRPIPATISYSALAGLRAELEQLLPASHRAFLTALRRSFSLGSYLFVHAGIRPGVDLSKQDPADLVWIREPFLSCPDDFGCIIVHGHTPCEEPEVRTNRINIDTGAFIRGRLTCLVLEGDERRFITAGIFGSQRRLY